LDDVDAIEAGDTVRGTGDVVRVPVGQALLGRVVDPLGRPLDGKGRVAMDTLTRYAGEPIESLIQRCHQALTGTRGAVMSLASFDFLACTMNCS
jgi:F0F1-type ATP synthase alpha subunit